MSQPSICLPTSHSARLSESTNDVAALAVGQVHYSTILNDRGTIEDDCLVYRFADRIMMVVNASNIAKDLAHVEAHLPADGVTLEDQSSATSLLAVQGPRAAAVVGALADVPLDDLKSYWKRDGRVAGVPTILSRTGYTGEDGFELYFDREGSELLADVLRSLDAAGDPAQARASAAAWSAKSTDGHVMAPVWTLAAGFADRDGLTAETGGRARGYVRSETGAARRNGDPDPVRRRPAGRRHRPPHADPRVADDDGRVRGVGSVKPFEDTARLLVAHRVVGHQVMEVRHCK